MTKPRYLTKSRFKMATECPTKLFYTAKKEYGNTSLDDPFLAALADGGHQVGELAKRYFPGGEDITTLDYKEALCMFIESTACPTNKSPENWHSDRAMIDMLK